MEKETESKKMTETESDGNNEERSVSPLIRFSVEEESCEVDD